MATLGTTKKTHIYTEIFVYLESIVNVNEVGKVKDFAQIVKGRMDTTPGTPA
jgi:hypothetical protein